MRRMTTNSLLYVAAVIGSLVLLNIIGLRAFARLDLTREKVYTLARASEEAVKDLKEPVIISAYFSEQLPPPYSDNARFARDLLEEFRSASGGKVSFEFIDPMSQETAEDKELKKEVKRDIFGRTFREPTSVEIELQGLGIQPVEIMVFEEDKRQTKRAYMGLVIRHQEKKEVIPVVQQVKNLEYDITSLIRKLTRTRTPVMGLAYSGDGMTEKLRRLNTLLGQNYDVRMLDLASAPTVGDDVDALWVLGPKSDLSVEAQKSIDQMLMKGKSVALFLDNVQVDLQSFQPTEVQHGLSGLLSTYGVTLSDELVADAQSAQLNVQEQRGFMVINMPVPYPFIPMLTQLEGDSPVSKGLTGVAFPFAARVTAQSAEDRTWKVLARSSAKSWLEARPYNLTPNRDWRNEVITPSGPYDLMVQVTGKFKSHFASEASTGILKESQGEARLLVAGTSSLLWDAMMEGPSQVLALNIADWMLLDSGLLEMRSRELIGAPLKPELAESVRNAVKYGNVFVVPLLLAAYGLVRWGVRNNRRKAAVV